MAVDEIAVRVSTYSAVCETKNIEVRSRIIRKQRTVLLLQRNRVCSVSYHVDAMWPQRDQGALLRRYCASLLDDLSRDLPEYSEPQLDTISQVRYESYHH